MGILGYLPHVELELGPRAQELDKTPPKSLAVVAAMLVPIAPRSRAGRGEEVEGFKQSAHRLMVDGGVINVLRGR